MSRTSLCREVSKTTQVRGSTGAACHGDVADKECTCLASRLMRERYPPSPPIHWGLSRLADCKSAVPKRAGRRRVEHYHQLPPFNHTHPWVPKPKSSRRTVVNRVINECKSRRDRHGCNLPRARGRHQSARLGTERHPGRHRGARPLFLPVAQEQSL